MDSSSPANLHLPAFHMPSKETREKAGSVFCATCLVTWGIAGLAITVALVSKLIGLI